MPELVTVNDSEYRCSSCTNFELRLYRDNVKKSPEEWQQFIYKVFANHLQRCHTRKEFLEFTTSHKVSL